MPQTENTPNLEMRTCVTCGKSFYVNLDDEKIRAANGIAPRRECYNCLCARTQFIEQRAKAEQESDIMRIFEKFRKWIKFGVLAAAMVNTLFLISLFISYPGGMDLIFAPYALAIVFFWIFFLKL